MDQMKIDGLRDRIEWQILRPLRDAYIEAFFARSIEAAKVRWKALIAGSGGEESPDAVAFILDEEVARVATISSTEAVACAIEVYAMPLRAHAGRTDFQEIVRDARDCVRRRLQELPEITKVEPDPTSDDILKVTLAEEVTYTEEEQAEIRAMEPLSLETLESMLEAAKESGDPARIEDVEFAIEFVKRRQVEEAR